MTQQEELNESFKASETVSPPVSKPVNVTHAYCRVSLLLLGYVMSLGVL